MKQYMMAAKQQKPTLHHHARFAATEANPPPMNSSKPSARRLQHTADHLATAVFAKPTAAVVHEEELPEVNFTVRDDNVAVSPHAVCRGL